MLANRWLGGLGLFLVMVLTLGAPPALASKYGECLFDAGLYQLHTCTSSGSSGTTSDSTGTTTDDTTGDVSVVPDNSDQTNTTTEDKTAPTLPDTEKGEANISWPAIVLGVTAIGGGGLWIIIAYLRRKQFS